MTFQELEKYILKKKSGWLAGKIKTEFHLVFKIFSSPKVNHAISFAILIPKGNPARNTD